MATLIAFDTATERMTIACAAASASSRTKARAARASATLLPAILGLLGEAGIAVADLDAIAFGRGPGAFTGLRTACSVAQGLAFGAGKRVLPIDSLLAVAEDARGDATRVSRLGAHRCADGPDLRRRVRLRRRPLDHARRAVPDRLRSRWRRAGGTRRRRRSPAMRSALRRAPRHRRDATLFPTRAPTRDALLRLAEHAWADGAAVDAGRAPCRSTSATRSPRPKPSATRRASRRGSEGARPSLSEGGERSGAGAILSSEREAAKPPARAHRRPMPSGR